MKLYSNPQVSVVPIQSADILTVSESSNNVIRLDFGSDFAKGLTGGNQGNSASMNWYDDFS